MEIAGKRFLVIGGAGFIGSHVVDQLLDAGASYVRIYDNFSRGSRENLQLALQDPRIEIFPDGGDILHRDMLSAAMKDIDGVFHLAAMWLLQCNQYPRAAFDVNVVGTMNVAEAAISAGIRKLVFSSSASVYGDAITEPMEESHPLDCQEFYGASKVCGEMVIRALFNRAQQSEQDIEYVGLRYMNVYGPRQYRTGAYLGVVASMMNALQAGENLTIHGDGTQSYDFVDVRDCASANLHAMESDVSGEYFNVGTGKKVSISDLAKLLLHTSSSPLKLEYRDTARSYVRTRLGSTKNAESKIGFVARITLQQGIADLLQGFRA